MARNSGHRQQDVDHTHQDAVNDPAGPAGDSTHDDSADQPEHDGDNANGEADLGAVEDAAEFVAALQVRAHEVGRAGPVHAVGQSARRRAVGGYVGCQDRPDDEDGNEYHAHDRRTVAQQSPEGVVPQAAACPGGRWNDDGGRGRHLSCT